MENTSSNNPLSPAQLADGARLLEVYDRVPPPTDPRGYDLPRSELLAWLLENSPALLSAAQRVAEVERCVREIVNRLDQCANDCLERSREDTPIAHGAGLGAMAYSIARSEVVKIASRHNIDLSEPGTTAGEAKGST